MGTKAKNVYRFPFMFVWGVVGFWRGSCTCCWEGGSVRGGGVRFLVTDSCQQDGGPRTLKYHVPWYFFERLGMSCFISFGLNK